jgi:hypothetical protein
MRGTGPTADESRGPSDEELVAYLDGELEGQTRRELEQRLLKDDVARRRLKELQVSFELLGDLPAATVDDQFTRSTLEMAVLNASQTMPTWRHKPIWRVRTLALCAALVALAGLGGWGVTELNQLRIERSQLEDLPAAQYLDQLRAIDDLELVRQLSDDLEWQQQMALAVDVGELQLPDASRWLGLVPAEERLEAVSMFSPQDRATLASQFEMLTRQLPNAERTVIRQRARLLSETPAEQRQDLLRTVLQYGTWINTLVANDQARIRDAKGPQRRAVIDEILERDRGRWIAQYPLSASDKSVVIEWMLGQVRSAISERQGDDAQRDRAALEQFERLLNERNGRARDRASRSPTNFGAFRVFALWMERGMTDAAIAEVRSRLSAEAREKLETMNDLEEQREILRSWVGITLRDRFRTPDASQQLYLQMDSRQQEQLDLLPADEFLAELNNRAQFRGPMGRPPRRPPPP